MVKSTLYSSVSIGGVTLKNRVIMAPMSTGYESEDGTVNQALTDYWVARAKGGVGLILVDAVTVDTKVPYLTKNTLSLGEDRFIPSLKEFTDKIHSYGCKVFPQITHPGPESISWSYGVTPVGPSVNHNVYGKPCRELSLEEIPAIIEQYGEAARRAREAGCDGVEFHCAHAYMLAGAFLSPLRNKRADKYGGDLDGRARFALEIIRCMKEKAGSDFPILIRISGDERVPGGNTLEDILYLVPKFIQAGVDAFEVSGGTQYERCDQIIPCHYDYPGVNLKEAEAIKKISDVPVVVVGKIGSAQFAEHVVDTGLADAVVLGRPLLADPELTNKAWDGKYEDIIPCASCGGACITRDRSDPVAHCVINPALGREEEWAIKPAKKAKTVAVIGGGPGGLQAARVAAMRGHQVTLFEKAGKLGGQINLASVPPYKQELTGWICYLSNQMSKLGVDVRLNTEATPEAVLELKPDAVIVATGSVPFIPPIKGVAEMNPVTGADVLTGAVPVLSGKVLVIGGNLVGCEVADFVLQNARGPMSVRIVEMLPDIVATLCPNNKMPLLNRLYSKGTTVSVNTKVVEIKGKDVTVEKDGRQETWEGFDHILFCSGSRPVDNLSEALQGKVPEIYVIGDAQKVDMARKAIEEGYACANAL